MPCSTWGRSDRHGMRYGRLLLRKIINGPTEPTVTKGVLNSMTDFLKQFSTAVFGGIISLAGLSLLWFYSTISDDITYRVASTVIGRLDFQVFQSTAKDNRVEFDCPKDYQLVSANCIGNGIDNAQVAVGPIYNQNRSFACNKYGSPSMLVQAFAICFRVKK